MRSVVITGVSRGLGAALFDEFYDHGDRILAIGRGFSEAQQGLAATDPERVLLRHADLADPLSQPDAVELAEFLRGHAVLVLNAAVVTPIGAVGAVPAAELVAAATVNLAAPMVLTSAFLAATDLAAGGPGASDPGASDPDAGHPGATERAVRRSVLFISSGAARRVIGGWAAYCATKAGAEMFFAALAEQEGGRTYVASVNPGVMDTGMQEQLRAAGTAGAYFPDAQRYLDLHEQRALPTPAQVARQILAEHLGEAG